MPALKGPSILQPWWQTQDGQTVRLYHGDVLQVLRRLPSRSVHMVCTSPPYWGLRDYGTGTWEGGQEGCDHTAPPSGGRTKGPAKAGPGNREGYSTDGQFKHICGKCGARRIDHQLGNERVPDCLGWARGENCALADWQHGCYICRMRAVFGEVKRVLRGDGTCWINMGDSYAGGGGGNYGSGKNAKYTDRTTYATNVTRGSNLPSGNLCGIPWRLALGLQTDGWVLRQDIIWSKPAPMPESVTSRCTKSHEYLFLLTKQGSGYFYDAEAIKEKQSSIYSSDSFLPDSEKDTKGQKRMAAVGVSRANRSPDLINSGRNKRSVWVVSSQGYPGAHFATYPPKLITPCILAGTSAHGCCIKCGAPWRRVVEVQRSKSRVSGGGNCIGKQGYQDAKAEQQTNYMQVVCSETVGWQPTCECGADTVVPCIVLDPFVGSGTTCCVAFDHGRRSWGIDLSEQYLLENALPRIRERLALSEHHVGDLGITQGQLFEEQ